MRMLEIWSPAALERARSLSRLAYCNPFLPERRALEREVLGERFIAAGPVWSARADLAEQNPNLPALTAAAESLAGAARAKLADGERPSAEEVGLYEDVVHYLLYNRHEERLWQLVVAGEERTRSTTARIDLYADIARDAAKWLDVAGLELPSRGQVPHLFALAFQLRRAFHFIFWTIVGRSLPAARFRAEVWHSIFTHDLRRYRRGLYARMGEVATLVTGPTGTGKELVARAIALSRYVPFDARGERFTEDFATAFFPLNLSALSPSLIESELFGYRRGAFTGALADRSGWLEVCPPHGAVFLDEIGEIDAALQVKLLRVLQMRTFQRLGETTDREFRGKVIAATNRDLADEIRAGRFREDFYYRLCSDRIETPSLAEQIRDSPGDLANLVLFIARRIVGTEEARGLADEVVAWLETGLGRDYAWPGNVRELEQCVRSVMLRRRYDPPADPRPEDEAARLAREIRDGALSAESVLDRYCSLVHAKTGSYVETARRLGLDRRTVKRRAEAARR
ncbi:MAG: sigma 54-interacting transcriptional regulator [Candidatus Binatia bacterium]